MTHDERLTGRITAYGELLTQSWNVALLSPQFQHAVVTDEHLRRALIVERELSLKKHDLRETVIRHC
jgi:hypothetical protein